MTDNAPSSKPDASTDRLVPAVQRAVQLLDAMAASREPQTLADLSRRLNLPRSSVHGLLATLVALDLARRNQDAAFTIGPKALQWADAFGAQSDVLRAFEAHASRIDALATETVMLAMLEGTDVVYLACRQGTRPLAVNFRVGGRFPAACTSSGKAMLASLSDAQVRERLGSAPLKRLTRHGVSGLPALTRQLQSCRREGYAIDDEETAQGMQCFGAAIMGARATEASAAVAVSVIKAGLTPQRRAELIAGVRELAANISADLGAPATGAPTRPVARASSKPTSKAARGPAA